MSLIRRNILWLMVTQLATWAATLVALLVVPNSLGSADLGAFGYATGYTQFFALIAGLGSSAFLARAIARDYDLFGPYVWNAVVLKLLLWAAVSAIAMGLAYALGNRGQVLVLIAISCAGMLPYLLLEVFSGSLAGMQRMARPAMWVVVQVYYQTVVGILVLALGWGVVAYTFVMVIGPVIPTIATAIMARPLIRGHRTVDLRLWRLMIVGGVPLVALTFFNLIYGTLDVPILHNLAGDDAVGWYVLALRWVGIPIFIVTAVTSAYFPAMSQHGNPITEEFAPLVNKAIHIVLVITIPASVGLALVANDVMHLVYGTEYDQSIVLIQILALGMPPMAMDTILAIALVTSNRINRYLIVAAVAAVLNPIACVILINLTDDRYGNGAIGAAIVTVGTEVWVMVGALVLRSPGVLDRGALARLVRVVFAAGVMVPVLLLSRDLPVAVQVILGLVSYGAASLAFGVFSLSELRELAAQTMSRGQRREQLGDEPDEGNVDDGTGVGPASAARVGGDLHP